MMAPRLALLMVALLAAAHAGSQRPQFRGTSTPSDGVGFGLAGGAPKKCSGYMAGNEVDWSKGIATVSNYAADGGGAFGKNFGTDKKSPGGAYGAAYPSAAFNTGNYHKGTLWQAGLCDDGISAKWGEMPNIKGEPLCFKLTNQTSGFSIDVQVTENCGGNCFNSASSGHDTCDTSNECNSINLGSEALVKANRCRSSQECNWPANFTRGYNDDMTNPAQTCAKQFHDWCSGVYAHFDLGMLHTNPDYEKLCYGGNNCIVQKERVTCP